MLCDHNRSFSFKSCSTSQVQTFLKKLEAKKATGLDRVPSKLLKFAAGALAPSLALNQSLSSGIVPKEWKLARVTPIFQDVNNYRPISIIPGVA